MTESIENIIRNLVREVVREELASLRDSISLQFHSEPTPTAREYLSVSDAGQATHRHPVTIRLALQSGELHGTQSQKGGRWLIRRTCLVAWAEHDPCEHQTS